MSGGSSHKPRSSKTGGVSGGSNHKPSPSKTGGLSSSSYNRLSTQVANTISNSVLSIAKSPMVSGSSTKKPTTPTVSAKPNNQGSTSTKPSARIASGIIGSAVSLAKLPMASGSSTKKPTTPTVSAKPNNQGGTSTKSSAHIASGIVGSTLSIAKSPMVSGLSSNKKAATPTVSAKPNNQGGTSTKSSAHIASSVIGSAVSIAKSPMMRDLSFNNKAAALTVSAISATKSPITNETLANKSVHLEYVRDPISGKIVSRSDFQKGISKSLELAKQYTFKPNAIIKDPISGQPTDIFSLTTDIAKRSNFDKGITKEIEKSNVKFSDFISHFDAAVQIGEAFTPEKLQELKKELGFWSQATGGVAKFTTYAEIGIDITKGDFNSAAERILKTGFDVASASTVVWALSNAHPVTRIAATTLAGIYGGEFIISIKDFLSKYSKLDLTPTLPESLHYNQSNTPGKLRIINQVDHLKQSISNISPKDTGISNVGYIKTEPAQIILLGKE
ncbi:hypothetical protein A1D29_03445 [Pasteurellaceae bacterium Orientalotternb1]|nr:hypothetical protein A1D29_03445 [Pasteurellaceae bacterium Orientalotternb1]